MSAKRSGKFMASLVLAIVLCLLLISGGCSDSSNDGGSAGKLVNYVLSKEFTAQEVADTDDDGLLEFVDAWGEPLRFYRWPTRMIDKAGKRKIVININPRRSRFF